MELRVENLISAPIVLYPEKVDVFKQHSPQRQAKFSIFM
jgi:hypothetical protein